MSSIIMKSGATALKVTGVGVNGLGSGCHATASGLRWTADKIDGIGNWFDKRAVDILLKAQAMEQSAQMSDAEAKEKAQTEPEAKAKPESETITVKAETVKKETVAEPEPAKEKKKPPVVEAVKEKVQEVRKTAATKLEGVKFPGKGLHGDATI